MENNMISNFIKKIVLYICFIILILMFLSTVYFIYKDESSNAFGKIACYIFICCMFGLLYYISGIIYAKKPKLFIVFVMIVSVISCTAWNLYSKTVPVSDYEVLMKGAEKIASGTFSEAFDKTSYFYIYNFQIGYAAYLAVIFKILGSRLIWYKLFEVVYIAAGAFFVFAIAGKLAGERIAAMASILYSTFIFNILGSSIINNQHLSAFLMLVGLYLLTVGKKISVFFAGVVFACMNVVRPVGIIIIIGVIADFIYKSISERKWREYLIKAVIFIVSFYSVIWMSDIAFVKAGIAPSAISKSHVPYFKMVIGMGADGGSIFGNYSTSAEHTNVYYDLKAFNFSYENYNDACIQFLKQRVKDYKSTAKYLFEKMRFFMGEKDHQYTFALGKERQESKFVKNITGLAHTQYLIIILFSLITLMNRINNKSSDINITHILFIGFILVHIFIEAQTRYRYDAYILMFIFASEGMEYLFSNIKRNTG